MSHLIFIRHSITRQQPDVTSHAWTLTPEGERRCITLADELRPYDIERFFSSEEPKAIMTAELVAGALNLTSSPIAGVQETRRDTVPYYDDIVDFQTHIKRGMDHPEQVIFGEEAFNSAYDRFDGAVHRLIATYPDQTLAVVTHGTVLSLFMGRHTDYSTYDIWRQLDMPAYAVFRLPDMTLEKFVPSIAE